MAFSETASRSPNVCAMKRIGHMLDLAWGRLSTYKNGCVAAEIEVDNRQACKAACAVAARFRVGCRPMRISSVTRADIVIRSSFLFFKHG